MYTSRLKDTTKKKKKFSSNGKEKMPGKKIRIEQNLCEESVKSLRDRKEKLKTWKHISYLP